MKSSDRRGVLMLAFVGGILAVLGVLGGILDGRRDDMDPATGCVVGQEASAETTVLIDLTDRVSPSSQARLGEWFHQFERGEIRDDERLTLWTLSGSSDGILQRRLCRCQPKREVNPLVANKAMAQALADSVFVKPFFTAVDELPFDESAATTPLLEAVSELCSQPEFAPRGVPRRLVLVSNLEQNSRRLSFYHRRPSFEFALQSGRLNGLAPDLSGVAVTVLYVPHGQAATDLGNDLQLFWRAYFRSCGADSIAMRRL